MAECQTHSGSLGEHKNLLSLHCIEPQPAQPAIYTLYRLHYYHSNTNTVKKIIVNTNLFIFLSHMTIFWDTLKYCFIPLFCRFLMVQHTDYVQLNITTMQKKYKCSMYSGNWVSLFYLNCRLQTDNQHASRPIWIVKDVRQSLQLRKWNGCHAGTICLAGIRHTPSAERRRDWRPAPSNEVTPGTLGLISLSRIGPIRRQMSNKYVGPMWGYLRSWNINKKPQPLMQP